MTGQPLTNERMQYLTEHYEDVILAFLEGCSLSKMLEQVVPNGASLAPTARNLQRRHAALWLPAYYKWLEELPGTQREEVEASRTRGAEQVVGSIEDTLADADESTKGGVAKAKALAEFRRWYAGTLDSRYKDQQVQTNVQINLGEMFTRALEGQSNKAKSLQVIGTKALSSGDVV